MVHSTDMGDAKEFGAFDLDVPDGGLASQSIQKAADLDFVPNNNATQRVADCLAEEAEA